MSSSIAASLAVFSGLGSTAAGQKGRRNFKEYSFGFRADLMLEGCRMSWFTIGARGTRVRVKRVRVDVDVDVGALECEGPWDKRDAGRPTTCVPTGPRHGFPASTGA